MIYAACIGLGIFIGGFFSNDGEVTPAAGVGFLVLAITGLLYIGKTYL